MSQEPVRFTQEIVEILPADLLKNKISYKPKGIKKLDPRKTCLDCGYLRYVTVRQVDVIENGKPVFERKEGVVNAQNRSQILAGGNNQISAKDLDCFRGKWSTAYSGDVLELSLEGDTLVAKPKKKAALEALKEIRQAFESSGVTEDELQETGRRARQEVTKERDSARA